MFANENSGLIGGISLLITITGLILTLGGLAMTYIQLVRTRTATEEVKAKTDAIKNQVNTFDVSVDIIRASKLIDQILALRRSGSFQYLLAPLEEAHLVLYRISMSLSNDEDFTLKMRSDADYCSDQVEFIESALEKGISPTIIDLIAHFRGTRIRLEAKLLEIQKGLYDA